VSVDDLRAVIDVAPGIPGHLIVVKFREILFGSSRLLELEERVLLVVSINVDGLYFKGSPSRGRPLFLKEVDLFGIAACVNLEDSLINWLRWTDIEQIINGNLSHGYSIHFLCSF